MNVPVASSVGLGPGGGPDPSTVQARRWAWWLGLGGLAPFVAHAAIVWSGPAALREWALHSQVLYAAAILTFVGALHWGLALAAPALSPASRRFGLIWSVLPSLWCWIAAQWPARTALLLIALGLLVALVVDLATYRKLPLPAWFTGMRLLLTLVATAALMVTWLAPGAR